MKIAILSVQVPFVRGGAEYLAESLAGKLRERGHRVEQVNVPFKWYPEKSVLQHMLACHSMRIDAGSADLAIALKFPAYFIPYRRKRLWLLHQFRQVYDLWGTEYSGMRDTPEAHALRDAVRAADAEGLRGAERIFTNSRIVARRLATYSGVPADKVLYPPLDRPGIFRAGERQAYAFYPSRMGEAKRQHIAVEAMRHVRSPIQLVLAGKPDSAEYGERLRKLVEVYGLRDKVRFEGWITEEHKAELMAGAFCGVYLPYDEDSYGYVTLEAFHSHKPLVTFRDSGGVHEIVEDGRNGLITEPDPVALAAALDRLWEDRALCEHLGAEGRATIDRYDIHWDHLLDTLTG